MGKTNKEKILRVLLNEPDGSLTKYKISKLSKSSTSWTIDYLKNLEEKGLIENTRVNNVRSLIEEWIEISKYPRYFDFFINEPEKFLKQVQLKYALTTYFADNVTNKILFPSRADVYINRDAFDKWKGKLSEKALIGKGNFRLLIDDDHVFYERRKINDLWIVSNAQLMVDLKREGGVCIQAYEKMVNDYV